MKPKIILSYLFLVIWFGYTNAQEVISSFGTNFKSSETITSSTLGEPIIQTIANNQCIVTQGFHQSKLIITALDDILDPLIKLSAYPNPVDYVLNLKITNIKPTNLNYRLYDISGKLLLDNTISNEIEEINMQHLISGYYLLKVYSENDKPVQSFKILKR